MSGNEMGSQKHGNLRPTGEFVTGIRLRGVAMSFTLEAPRALAQLPGLTPIDCGLFERLLLAGMSFAVILAGIAATRRISWIWCIGAIFGLAFALSSVELVAWLRGSLP